MLICHSPNISISGNDYFSSKSIASSAACSPMSGGGKAKILLNSNRSRDASSAQAVRGDLSINNTENGDSDNDTELDDDENERRPQPFFAKLNLPKQDVPLPPVFVTSPSKPPTTHKNLVTHSYSPEGALKTSPDSILGLSSTEKTPQLSPTTSAESDRLLADRRGSEASLLITDGAELPSSPPPRPPLSVEEEIKLAPNPPMTIPKPKPISTLTALIAEKKNKLDNPFAEDYSFFAGKGDLNPITRKIYLPFSTEPTRPMIIVVKRDASVEETIGYTLYQYWDEKREPLLDQKLCDVVQWNMRIVEDDGEIDEDFPALERRQKISKFSFDQFALCKATPAQVRQNEAVSTKTRPPAKESFVIPPSVNTDGTVINSESNITNLANGPSISGTSSTIDISNQIFLRIRLNLTPYEEVSHTTTINVSSEMPFQEVLEMICRKRKLDSNKYTFKIADTEKYINLEKAVESVGNANELALVERPLNATASMIPDVPPSPTSVKERSLVKRRTLNEPQPPYVSLNEYMSVYKKYTVNRKTPMFVGRHERVLAIDGDYIHIMPSETRTMFESMKTSSYHIGSVMSCKVDKKAPTNFKLIINRNQGTKTYDFEAESKTLANEISQKVRFLQNLNKGESKARSHVKY
ncbi:16_t:CDS:2 [Acaulospora colombiana]|uniref:16_t:CDS:1 n=1 Tax=Acaulospora colombiana TaxID=27376 RepID=A0ACA9KH72_9GLOM|nr:16_t:CDS:2 [Acaulospora colombiana]